MTRRWNQITRSWRHFLRCCSHCCESCCCRGGRSQVTFIFAIYRTRPTLKYDENALDYFKTYRNRIWPEYHFLSYLHYRDRNNIILPYIFSPKLLYLLDMCSIHLNDNHSFSQWNWSDPLFSGFLTTKVCLIELWWIHMIPWYGPHHTEHTISYRLYGHYENLTSGTQSDPFRPIWHLFNWQASGHWHSIFSR